MLNNQLFVVGGCTPDGAAAPTDRTDVYDPAANTWTPVAPALTARSYAGAAVIGNQLFVVGGCVNAGLCLDQQRARGV